MLNDLRQLIEKTSDLQTAIFILKDIYEESERILKRNDVPLEEAGRMLIDVRDIRSQLTELEGAEPLRKDVRMLRSIRYLKTCYAAIETGLETIIAKPGKKRERGIP